MSKLNYTPGPYQAGRPDMRSLDNHGCDAKWIYAGNDYLACVTAFKHVEGQIIVFRSWEEVMATAHLLEAAPDMRDALESLVENIISGEGGCDFIKQENLDKAIAALKKANGEKC